MVGLAEDSRQLSLAQTRLVAADILHEIRIRRVAPKRRSLLRPGTQCSLDLSKRQRKHGLHFSMEKHSKISTARPSCGSAKPAPLLLIGIQLHCGHVVQHPTTFVMQGRR